MSKSTKHGAVIVLIALLAFVIGVVFSARAQEALEKEKEGIRKTAQTYVDALNNRDAEGIKKAFHPVAVLYAAGRNGLSDFPRWRWVEGMEKNPAKPADWVAYTSKVTVLDVGETVAVAKVELDHPTHQFTDYLSMVKLDGEWKIVNKIYHRRDKK